MRETAAFSLLLPGGQASIENNTLSKICTTSFCTYNDKCLICEPSKAYPMSLTTENVNKSETDTGNQNHINLDSNIAMENDDSFQEGLGISNLREIRLNHFQPIQPPVRCKHSIGSPSFLISETIRPVTEVSKRTPNPEWKAMI